MSKNAPNDLYEQFVRIEWLFRRMHSQSRGTHGPMVDRHRGQGRILALLRLNVEISQRELSAILDIRSQSLGELLAKLERKGFITRTPSKADRRVMEIRLTDTGRDAAETEEPDNPDMFACLTDVEQDTLRSYLDRIIASVEQNLEVGESERGRYRRRLNGRPFTSFLNHPFTTSNGFGDVDDPDTE